MTRCCFLQLLNGITRTEKNKSMKPVILKHIFKPKQPSDQIASEFCAYGKTPELAQKSFSNDGADFDYLRTETLEYPKADCYAEVAAALGADWKATPQSDEYADCNWILTRKDGLALFIGGGGWNKKGRISISHSRPRHKGSYLDLWLGNNKLEAPSITVADTTPPAKIAKAITSRLLPDSEVAQEAAITKIAQLDAADDAQQKSAQAVAGIFGKPLGENYHTKQPETSGYFKNASWTANFSGSVSFAINSATPEQAKLIAAALKSNL